ncbi:hypothetical protein [Flavobacterium capsici]|uniref:Uncharacterized protein n=1 Tax=Flavobacterium capsici TaxID=3075618 RepID=A0AA96EX72_9FLAO|nr:MULTISPECIES: hypothetical protein [unclassified Flavobacterium]WNM19821.1 hypothetical protein RN608_03860 [Flavobacterium sp. PMR2A8]WNM21210.1 hypothetical protein RN605_11030 [Flavobacterium sp. PMTSA4]
MKKLSMLIVAFICFTVNAQTRQTTINYELTRTNGLENVGADLVIGNLNLCPLKDANKQLLFESQSTNTIFINVNNRSGGNSCVTLIVVTQNETMRIEIPENTDIGVRQFLRVKRAFLKIEKTVSDRTVSELKSIGTATVWF